MNRRRPSARLMCLLAITSSSLIFANWWLGFSNAPAIPTVPWILLMLALLWGSAVAVPPKGSGAWRDESWRAVFPIGEGSVVGAVMVAVLGTLMGVHWGVTVPVGAVAIALLVARGPNHYRFPLLGCLVLTGVGLLGAPGPGLVAAVIGSWALILVAAVLVLHPPSMSRLPGVTHSRRAFGLIVFTTVLAVLAAIIVQRVPPPSFGKDSAQQSRPGDYDQGPMDLNARGPLGTDPVAVVPADSPQYWRSGVLTLYTGRMFVSPRTPTTGLQRGVGGWDVTPLMSNGTGSTSSVITGYDVTPLLPRLALLAPDHLLQITGDLQQMRIGGEAGLSQTGTEPYRVSVAPTRVARDSAPSAVATIVGADPNDQRFLEPGLTVTPRTRALAVQITAGANGTAAKVAAVEDYLRSHYTYNLDAPVAPQGTDAVDQFLFESRQGFCEHFAAAEVVLLRSVGVPARVAVGYLGGTPVQGDPTRRQITQDRAHAWTEVYQPGSGWLRSDSTPSGPGQGPTATATPPRHDQDVPWWWIAAGAALILVLGLLIWWFVRRRRTPAPRSVDPLDAAYAELVAALREDGIVVNPMHTRREVAELAGAGTAPFLVMERTTFAPALPERTERDLAAAELRELANARWTTVLDRRRAEWERLPRRKRLLRRRPGRRRSG